ncbi:MAG: hypothetical protein II720_01835, partial [Bacteroidales bacterium]|nr:hypothetical protein [Bacteroidales bacterium]
MIKSVIIGLCLTVTFACSCHTQGGGKAVQPSEEPQAVNDPSQDPSGDVRPSGPRNVLWLGPGWNLGNQMDA